LYWGTRKASASFLKKRSKKRLLLVPFGRSRAARNGLESKSFFASFFSKKEVLTCLAGIATPA
jgi:hypothetical protein